MVIDTSAILAILLNEPDADQFAQAIQNAETCRISAATYFEAAAVVDRRGDAVARREFDLFIRRLRPVIESVTLGQAEAARQAYRDFGKGKHKAGLNFGDCFSYALAKAVDEPLLYKGSDFSKTDVESAQSL